jgi:hypothetical protein
MQMHDGSADRGSPGHVPNSDLPAVLPRTDLSYTDLSTAMPDCDLPSAMSACELSELLFCSTLQPSQVVDTQTVIAALAQSLHSNSGRLRACAAELADSYGRDPETTCSRMRWARTLIANTYPKAG